MNNYATVVVITEGPTEQSFVKEILCPYMEPRGVLLTPVILHKPGVNGGDVKFARARNDIERFLKQRSDTYLTLLVDYYGIGNDWPGYADAKRQVSHTRKAEVINAATAETVSNLFPEQNPHRRFIPYVSMHEIEALFFSDPSALAEKLGVQQTSVDDILDQCGEPEKINDSHDTAPSKRLHALNGRYKKTVTGFALARAIGIPKMRSACPLFNAWLERLEKLMKAHSS
jgi:hypothetical protein